MTTTLLHPYKGRAVKVFAPVKVYRNLHGNAGHRYSLLQDGLVVAHADNLVLDGVTFKVNEAGRQRVLVEKRKNVHAFIVGYVAESCGDLPARVSYNPYKAGTFMAEAPGMDAHPATNYRIVSITPTGVTAAN